MQNTTSNTARNTSNAIRCPNKVDNKVVKIVELENYQRRIPEEIIQKIECCKGIFDKMYVVFTDYTKR